MKEASDCRLIVVLDFGLTFGRIWESHKHDVVSRFGEKW